MPADLLAAIEKASPSFSKGQHRISQYISEHYDKAAFMTASKLGSTVGVSESTVVRFASELGYDGYPELQRALQELIRNRLTTVQRMELSSEQLAEGGVLQKVLTSDIDRIRRTLEMTSEDDFARAVELIASARRVYIIGIRSSRTLAFFLHFYLHLITENAMLVGGESVSELYEQLLWVGEGDVVIGISFPRYSARTARALKYAKDSGANVIALTDSQASPLVPYSDSVLIAKSDMTSFVDSLVAPLSLINALLAAVGMKRGQEVASTLSKLEHIWDVYNVYEKSAGRQPSETPAPVEKR